MPPRGFPLVGFSRDPAQDRPFFLCHYAGFCLDPLGLSSGVGLRTCDYPNSVERLWHLSLSRWVRANN
jgi:hypothetical protein